MTHFHIPKLFLEQGCEKMDIKVLTEVRQARQSEIIALNSAAVKIEKNSNNDNGTPKVKDFPYIRLVFGDIDCQFFKLRGIWLSGQKCTLGIGLVQFRCTGHFG